jgi:cytoskeletal protein CcmA (bactofilin family)
MYADGELPAEEARGVQVHLDTCQRCGTLVDGLMQEKTILVQILQEANQESAPAANTLLKSSRAAVAQIAASVLGMAAGLRSLLIYLDRIQVPATLEWLNPFSYSGQVNLFVTTILYMAQKGASIMASVITLVSILTLAALVFGTAPFLFRRRKSAGAALGIMVLILAFSSQIYALEIRRSNRPIIVPAGETVDDTLIAGGDSVTVDGTITGDLIAFARRVVIRGTVKGSVISFAQSVEIDGIVEGSVLGCGQSVQTRGRVIRNVYAFAQSVAVNTAGDVGGNVAAFGSDALIEGSVARDAWTFANMTDVSGNVGRDLVAHGERVSLVAPARVGGKLVAYVSKAANVQIDPGATVMGGRDVQVKQSVRPYRTVSFYVWKLVWLAAAFLAGLLLFWLAPALAGVRLETGRALLTAGGVGFLATVATPIAVIILAITLIGLPIALISLAVWLVALYLAKIVVAAFLGQSLIRGSRFLNLLVGLALILVAVNIPYVGWVVNILLTLLGLGAIILRFWHRESALAV